MEPLENNRSWLTRTDGRANGHAENTIWDHEILKRVWVLIDFDPQHHSGISSADAAHEAARRCREYLRGLGWPDPILADSGNGAHLRYRFDLPNVPEIPDVIKRCLSASAVTDHRRPSPQG
jgi:hypothetical protein